MRGIAVAAAVTIGALAGCASNTPPKSIAVQTYRGYPSVDPPEKPGVTEPVAVRLSSSRLALTFLGSGSCPTVPTGYRWINPAVLEVDVGDDYPGACTADNTATTSVISVAPGRLLRTSFTVQFNGGVPQVPRSAEVR